MAAPSAGAILSDLGADVIRIEPLRGDPHRGMSRQPKVGDPADAVDAAYQCANRGKQSVAIAIDEPAGAEVAKKLIASADVLLTNLLAHRQQRYGLDPDALRAVNPKLVHATLTGYGTVGPDATRPGYDVTAFFGRSGVFHSVTEPDSSPPQAPTAMGDYTTGLAMTTAILAALRLAERTGEFQEVDVSLMSTAMWTIATEVAPTIIDGKPPRCRDRHHLFSPTINRYPCSDGNWILVNMPEARWWPKFCEAIGSDMGVDPDLSTPKQRYDRMPELVDRVDAITRTKTAVEWGEIFDAAGLIWGPVQSIADVINDPQARAVGSFVQVPGSDAHPGFETVAVPVRIKGAAIGPQRPASDLGADTDEVLDAHGIDAETRSSLRNDGILG